MQRFFFHPDGRLAGSYDGPDAGTPHPGLSSTEIAPGDGRQIWNGGAWEWPAAVAKERANAPVLAEIDRREKQSLRRMRELVLKLAALNLPNDANTVALEAADSAIATERGKLVP